MNWEAEGLLEGLESEKERAGRRELLDRLHGLRAGAALGDALRRVGDYYEATPT
jgi:hypothetical protein